MDYRKGHMIDRNFYDKKILLVDDDESILLMLVTVLRKEGYKNIKTAVSGEEAVSKAQQFQPDLIVLDVMLPDCDGYKVCQRIRYASMVPIIFLSARSDEYDRLLSYAFGGDEYMTKPFSPRELLARMNSIFNRQQYYEDILTSKPNQYSFNDFVIDMDKKMLLKDGAEVSLTAKEYKLLEYLITNRNLTLSKEQILENVWDSGYEGYDNSVMVHIRHLREKIEENPSDPVFLKTVRGRGYIFEG